MKETIAYILSLSCIKGLGARKLYAYRNELVGTSSFEEAWDLLCLMQEQYRRFLPKIPTKEAFRSMVELNVERLEKQEAMGIHSMLFTNPAFPKGFQRVTNPPLFFFYKGNKDALTMKSVALIGTRKTTAFTEKVGEHVGKYLAEKGWCVVSGLALGSDAAGHRGCLMASGKNVAVMATPLSEVYPKRNTMLAAAILDNGGCLISEYPIDTLYSWTHFVERDRLQSGLASGVFVVATGKTGGTWHAINEATRSKKPIAFFDYTSVSYNYKEDPHTLGMEKMKSLGAMPIGTEKDMESFLSACDFADKKDILGV